MTNAFDAANAAIMAAIAAKKNKSSTASESRIVWADERDPAGTPVTPPQTSNVWATRATTTSPWNTVTTTSPWNTVTTTSSWNTVTTSSPWNTATAAPAPSPHNVQYFAPATRPVTPPISEVERQRMDAQYARTNQNRGLYSTGTLRMIAKKKRRAKIVQTNPTVKPDATVQQSGAVKRAALSSPGLLFRVAPDDSVEPQKKRTRHAPLLSGPMAFTAPQTVPPAPAPALTFLHHIYQELGGLRKNAFVAICNNRTQEWTDKYNWCLHQLYALDVSGNEELHYWKGVVMDQAHQACQDSIMAMESYNEL